MARSFRRTRGALSSRCPGLGAAPLVPLEPRSLLAVVSWTGAADSFWHNPLNWNTGSVPGFQDDVLVDVAGTPTIQYTATAGVTRVNSLLSRERITFTGGELELSTTASFQAGAVLAMQGGHLRGGAWDLSAGEFQATTAGGTLSDVAITGDLRLAVTSSRLTVAGATTFSAARLAANDAQLNLAPGFTLTSPVIAEGSATGERTVRLAFGGAGTVSVGPSGSVTLAAGCGGGLTIIDSSAAFFTNRGVISAEANGRTLTLGGSIFFNSATGVVRVLDGTLTMQSSAWSNAGVFRAAPSTIINLGGNFDAAAGIGTFDTPQATVNLTDTVNNEGNTLTLDGQTGSWRLLGARVNGGSLAFADGRTLAFSTSGGILADVSIVGDLLLDVPSARVTLQGQTTFSAARLTASSVDLRLAPGYTLRSLVVSEGFGAGTRFITTSFGGAGDVFIASTGQLRLAPGSGGDLSVSNSSSGAIVNRGLIAADTPGRTLTLSPTSFANTGTLRVSAGILTIGSSTGWTNTGMVAGVGGVLNLGALRNVPGSGQFQTAAATVNISDTLVNVDATLTLSAATGSWRLLGGEIEGGTLAFADGQTLTTTTSGGMLDGVAIGGQLLLADSGSRVTLTGSTNVPEVRLQAGSTDLRLAPGFVLTGAVFAEGPEEGARSVTLAVGGTGVVTFAPASVVELVPGCAGDLNIVQSSAAILVNNGLIAARSAGQRLSISTASLTNNGEILATIGTLNIAPDSWTNAFDGSITLSGFTTACTLSGSWSSPGRIALTDATLNLGGAFDSAAFDLARFARSGGLVNLTGIADNGGRTLSLTPATGAWRLLGGTIDDGSLTFTGGARLVPTSGGGFLVGVVVSGDIVLDVGTTITLEGDTTFTSLRMDGSSTVRMAPGFTLQSPITAEGLSTGNRSIVLASGGAGSVTIAPSGSIRLAPGCGGDLSISNSSSATLLNQGLITAEAAGGILTISPSAFTNQGELRVSLGTLAVSTGSAWTNSGLVSASGGVLNLGAFDASAGQGTFATAGGTVNINGVLTNFNNTLTLGAQTGPWRLVGGTILGGSLTFVGGQTLRLTSSGGQLRNLAVAGDLLLDTPNTSVLLSGSTTFSSLRLRESGATASFAPGYRVDSPIFAEGGAPGARSLVFASGGAGTVTIGPTGAIYLAPACGGDLSLTNSSAAAIANLGVVSVQAAGRTLSINTTSFTNSGILTVTAGTLSFSTSTGWTNAGVVNGLGGAISLGTFNATEGIGIFNTASAVVTINGTLLNTGATLTLNAQTGSWRISGGTLSGGTLVLPTAQPLICLSGTLSGVMVVGDLLVEQQNSSISIVGSTRFTSIRLRGSNTTANFAPGSTLRDLIVAEGPATGQRRILAASGGAGTFTIATSGRIRLAPDCDGDLSISPSSAAFVFNNGLISAEAPGQSLTISSTVFTNAATGVAQAIAGNLTLSAPTTNFGRLVGVTGSLNISGTFDNTGLTQTLDGSTGSWNLLGGTILGGVIDLSDGAAIQATTSGGTLRDVVVLGDLVLASASSSLTLAGSTRFDAARLVASNSNLNLAPGYTLDSLVVAEGASTGTRFITIAFGGTSTAVIGPAGAIRLDASCGANLNIGQSSAGRLENFGLISAEALSHGIQIGTLNAGLLNHPGGRIEAVAGFVNLGSANMVNRGRLVGVTGQLNISGTLNNTGLTQTIDASTGSWRLLGGTISGGQVDFAQNAALVPTNSGGVLLDVAIVGDLVLDASGASLTLSGSTTFATARLAANVSLNLAPGYILTSVIRAEGPAAGTRTIAMAVGGTGTATIASIGSIRLAPGSGGPLSINNSSAATLINNGVISAEAENHGLSISVSTLNVSSTGVVQSVAGGLSISSSVVNVSSGILTGGAWRALGGTFSTNFGSITTNAASIELGAGSTWTALSQLRDNTGALRLVGGRDLATTPGGAGVFTNSGTLALSSGSQFSIAGAFTQPAAGRLEVELNDPATPLGTARLTATGALTLGGTLAVTLLPTWIPASGARVDFLSGLSLAGSFASVQLPSAPGGQAFQVGYDQTTRSVFFGVVASAKARRAFVPAANTPEWM